MIELFQATTAGWLLVVVACSLGALTTVWQYFSVRSRGQRYGFR